MAADENRNNAKVEANIHEGFYFNHTLKLPTVIKDYDRIEEILQQLGYLSCITVQIEDLGRTEHLYGSNCYNYLLARIADELRTIKDRELRGNDIFVADLYDTDTFIIFLSPPRGDRTGLVYKLENIAERIRVCLEKQVFNILYPYLKKYPRSSIGHALEIKNPMVTNMRLIRQLIKNSKKTGEFMAVRQTYMSRFQLQKIILEQELGTVFQPIVELESLNIIGYEALSRGPEGTEFHNPSVLFMVAHETGLSFELDRVCRKKAFERLKDMETDKKIFVNTLGMTIHDPEFRGVYLKELLEDLELKPENVVFEISEKLAIDNYDLFRGAMRDYNDIGIVHANDDMGTGHSDLERLMELNPGYMKIDISFIKDIDKFFLKQEIIKALVNLAENINSHVVAEGIETREEYQTLKNLGVKYGQGFLFAEPSASPGAISTDFL